MAKKQLEGRRVAILVTDGFEQVEMTEPRKALEDAGAKADIVSPVKGQVQGMNHDEKGDKFPLDLALDSANRPLAFRKCFVAAGWSSESDIPAFNREMIQDFENTAGRPATKEAGRTA